MKSPNLKKLQQSPLTRLPLRKTKQLLSSPPRPKSQLRMPVVR